MQTLFKTQKRVFENQQVLSISKEWSKERTENRKQEFDEIIRSDEEFEEVVFRLPQVVKNSQEFDDVLFSLNDTNRIIYEFVQESRRERW